jgi:hypothetical protein
MEIDSSLRILRVAVAKRVKIVRHCPAKASNCDPRHVLCVRTTILGVSCLALRDVEKYLSTSDLNSLVLRKWGMRDTQNCSSDISSTGEEKA